MVTAGTPSQLCSMDEPVLLPAPAWICGLAPGGKRASTLRINCLKASGFIQELSGSSWAGENRCLTTRMCETPNKEESFYSSDNNERLNHFHGDGVLVVSLALCTSESC